MDTSIPEYIKATRKARGLTQKQVGIACGYEGASAERVVQLWEHGKQPIPINKLRALARVLGVDIGSLIP